MSFDFIKKFITALVTVTSISLITSISSHAKDMIIQEKYEYDYADLLALLYPDTSSPYPSGFPYRISLLYNDSIDLRSAENYYQSTGSDLYIITLRLYDENHLIQELPTESQGFMPIFEDFNFDGYIDLAIPLMPTNGPSMPYQYWLYNPQTDLFEDAPMSLQDIPSPDVDAQHQHISTFWRSGCCSHGTDVYHWANGELVLLENASSYDMPIKLDDDILFCYNVPFYDSSTGHTVDAIQLIQDTSGSLSLRFFDWSGHRDISEEQFIDEIKTYCENAPSGLSSPYPMLRVLMEQPSQVTPHYREYMAEPIETSNPALNEATSECYNYEIFYYDLKAHQIDSYIEQSDASCNG